MKFSTQVLLLTCLYVGSAANAEEEYAYPELEVVPRASARLASEANDESGRAWTSHVPIQASALFTITAGLLASQDEFEKKSGDDKSADQEALDGASTVAIGVGAAWLVATTVMSANYRPYTSCLKSIGSTRSKSKKAQLAKERAAEECLERPAGMARRLAFLSASTNFLAGGFVAATADSDFVAAMGGLAAVAAFAPYLFSYHWQDVAAYHSDYKKRIYGPVTSIKLFPGAGGRNFSPALTIEIPI